MEGKGAIQVHKKVVKVNWKHLPIEPSRVDLNKRMMLSEISIHDFWVKLWTMHEQQFLSHSLILSVYSKNRPAQFINDLFFIARIKS